MEHGEQLSGIARERALHPQNYGPIRTHHGYGKITGSCGDSMECWIQVTGDRITDIGFTTDGCASSRAAGSMATELARGRSLGDAAQIQPSDILYALGGLPQDSEHCALLATRSLQAAVRNASP